MTLAKTIPMAIFVTILLIPALAAPTAAQDLTPVQEQEYLDAREAIQAARRAQAEAYAAEPLQRAVAYLSQADRSRADKDKDPFTQAARLARAYGEFAETQAALNRERESLAAAQEELRKVKGEIERLKQR